MKKNNVRTFTSPEFKAVNGFVINDINNNAIIIDTAFGMLEEMKEYIEENGLNVKAIIVSHSHFDHIARLDEFSKTFANAEVYLGIEDINGLFDPSVNLSKFFNTKYGAYSCQAPQKIKAIKIYEEYTIGDMKFRFLTEGGHSKSSVMIDFFEDNVLFCGEILQGDCVEKLFPDIGDNIDLMEKNIFEIMNNYSEDYKLFPSHYAVGMTIKDAKTKNVNVQKILEDKRFN